MVINVCHRLVRRVWWLGYLLFVTPILERNMKQSKWKGKESNRMRNQGGASQV